METKKPIPVNVDGHLFSIDPRSVGSIAYDDDRDHCYVTTHLSNRFFFTFEGSREDAEKYRARIVAYIEEAIPS